MSKLTKQLRRIGFIDFTSGNRSLRTRNLNTYSSTDLRITSNASRFQYHQSQNNRLITSQSRSDLNLEAFNLKFNKSSSKPIKILTLNCQSCRETASDLHDILLNEKIDIALLSEKWFRDEGDEAYITALTPNGYIISSFPSIEHKEQVG